MQETVLKFVNNKKVKGNTVKGFQKKDKKLDSRFKIGF